MSRYQAWAAESAARIEHLKGQVARLEAKGLTVRQYTRDRIAKEIAEREAEVLRFNGAHKLVAQKFG